MTGHDWTLAVAAALLIMYAALSRRLDRGPITAAIFFVSAGLAFGSDGLGWIDLSPSSETVRLLAEATLTLVLFTDASRLDFGRLRAEYTVPLRLLGIGLPLTILLGAGLAAVCFGSLSVTEALVLGVLLAPTDAALGQAVVTDERLPSRIRQGLNVESGLNDGICVPLLLIVLAVAEADAGDFGVHEAVRIVFEEIGYGLVCGIAAGTLAAVVAGLAARRGWIEGSWLQVIPVAGAALCYGLADSIGGSGFIAAFVGGFVFGRISRSREGDIRYLLEESGQVLNAGTFLVFGAAILGSTLGALTWQVALYAVLSLTVVRMLPVAIAMLGTGARRPTLGFLGWFGPRGLASIVFAVIILDEAELPGQETILLATFATIALSVYAHGASARVLTNRYARWYESHPRGQAPMESVPAAHQRWRSPV
jgi:NhaP-type Na+/H+ or K+/H+ antiporter